MQTDGQHTLFRLQQSDGRSIRPKPAGQSAATAADAHKADIPGCHNTWGFPTGYDYFKAYEEAANYDEPTTDVTTLAYSNTVFGYSVFVFTFVFTSELVCLAKLNTVFSKAKERPL